MNLKEAVEKLKETFEDYDTNKNGYLEKEEFKAFHSDAKSSVQKFFPDLDCDDFEAFFTFFDWLLKTGFTMKSKNCKVCIV